MNKYPVYIVSKGRYKNPLTAKFMLEDGVPFKILVEPQEYEQYCAAVGQQHVLQLPFSNLGLGSYPARNYAFTHSIEGGHAKHWTFDDNIRSMRLLKDGKRIKMNALKAIALAEQFVDRYTNIGLAAFNYTSFVMPYEKKPFFLNAHCYSAMLMDNTLPFRWRMKYNEDVDLTLQALDSGLCTVLFNVLSCQKVSTVAKMKGGNQDELYKGNAHEKKVLKARSLEMVWPQYAETKMRFNRPHHFVDWKKHFRQPLIRRPDIDFDNLDITIPLNLVNV